MTSVVRFEEWQEPTGTTAATVDSSGNVSLSGDLSVSGSVTSTGNPQGLTLIKTQDIGIAVTSVTLTNVFSSAFENYRIVGLIQDASANAAITWQSPQDTNGNYQHAGYYINVYTTPTGATYFGAQSQNDAQCGFATSNSTGDGGAFIMDIFGPYDNTKQTKYFSTSISYISHSIWGRIVTTYTSLTDITFLMASGNFNGGTIRVYGYGQ